MFFVRPEDLTAGPVRFQCTSCHVIFGFDWPQPPGATTVKSELIQKPPPQPSIERPPLASLTASANGLGAAGVTTTAQTRVVPGVDNQARGARTASGRSERGVSITGGEGMIAHGQTSEAAPAKVFGEPGKPTRLCINCHSQVEYKYLECPKCGIIFDKVKRLRPPEPVVPAANAEIAQAWEAVRVNYEDGKRHEAFIQLCLAKENLAFASSQYRSILQVNPTEEVATKMQNRIIEMATMAYVAQAQVAREKAPKRSVLSNLVLIVGVLLVVTGLAIAQARSLVALGVSFIVFVIALRFFSRG